MADLTFLIPIGPLHQHLAQRAIDSVKAQSVPCAVQFLVDEGQCGPGALRNEMLRAVRTEFVSFLDADDWIEPTFAAETIAEYRRIGGGKYIFTDWYDDNGSVVEMPAFNGPNGYPLSVPDHKPYCGGTWHVVTTLMPTAWAREVGGFDETLPASEDMDFHLKLCTTMRCGHHLPRALFHYSSNGGRAIGFHKGPDYDRVLTEISMRYAGKMGCCGDTEIAALPVGERQPGDVLAMALWHGNHSEYGRVTGRHYARISMPRTTYIDPRDAAQSPNLWRVVEQPPTVDEPQGLTSVAQMAAVGMATVKRNPYAPPINEPPPPVVTAKPDVTRVLNLARKAGTGDPTFVFPDKDYPSYSDIKRLVQLSGFGIATFKTLDTFSRAPIVVVSPEPVPDLNGLKARVICWQLEYAGDYIHNYDSFRGEVWTSDKAWADAHGAKYVLMGSHPELGDTNQMNASHQRNLEIRYDVTMLGYMTPRRQAIKDKLSSLRWPEDYPGHMQARGDVLEATRLMLHVHQHDGAPYMAPQRIAIAAAYHMPVVSETVADAGVLADYLTFANYDKLPAAVKKTLRLPLDRLDAAKSLYDYLCIENTFRVCVEEALKQS